MVYQKLLSCYKSVREKIDFVPRVALVLGSGLGDYGDEIEIVAELAYDEIDDFPRSTVVGHEGKFLFGYVGNVPVVCMKGRVHYYEGYSISDVVLPIRLMKMLGAEILFLTNASGGIHPELKAGDFMLVTDHISNFVPNPLVGPNIEDLGTRFPDMSEVYHKGLRNEIEKTARDNGIVLKQGVYVQCMGPSFESPAEIKMFGRMGIDAVGMSTVVEAIAANHMGMKICCISFVANLAAGISPNPLTHEEVWQAANEAAPKFKTLVTESIINFGIHIL